MQHHVQCTLVALSELAFLSFFSLSVSHFLRQLKWLHATFSFGLSPFVASVHHALLHHVMCLFGTSMFSLNCLVSSPPFSSKHSSRAFLHSCLSWASCTLLSLSCSSLIFSSHFLLSSSRSHSSRVLSVAPTGMRWKRDQVRTRTCDTEKQGKTTLDHETCMVHVWEMREHGVPSVQQVPRKPDVISPLHPPCDASI